MNKMRKKIRPDLIYLEQLKLHMNPILTITLGKEKGLGLENLYSKNLLPNECQH